KLPAKMVEHFSPAEKEYFESIDPDAEFTVEVKDTSGNPVPQIDSIKGLELRNTYWLLQAFRVRSKLDAKTTEQLNRRLFGTPTGPAKGSKAEQAGAEILNHGVDVFQAFVEYGDVAIRLTEDEISDLESAK